MRFAEVPGSNQRAVKLSAGGRFGANEICRRAGISAAQAMHAFKRYPNAVVMVTSYDMDADKLVESLKKVGLFSNVESSDAGTDATGKKKMNIKFDVAASEGS